MHDADHQCMHCDEDDHMVAHVEGAHCEYEENHDELDVNEEHEVRAYD